MLWYCNEIVSMWCASGRVVSSSGVGNIAVTAEAIATRRRDRCFLSYVGCALGYKDTSEPAWPCMNQELD